MRFHTLAIAAIALLSTTAACGSDDSEGEPAPLSGSATGTWNNQSFSFSHGVAVRLHVGNEPQATGIELWLSEDPIACRTPPANFYTVEEKPGATNIRVTFESDEPGTAIASQVFVFRGTETALEFTTRDVDADLTHSDDEYCLALEVNDTVVLDIDACVVDCV